MKYFYFVISLSVCFLLPIPYLALFLLGTLGLISYTFVGGKAVLEDTT